MPAIAADSLARHPDAKGYSTFRDFHLYKINVTGSHLVAGFGRIVDLTPGELLTDCSDAGELAQAEESAIEHMNDDHGEALSLYATRLLGMPAGDWQTTGADPDGLDPPRPATARAPRVSAEGAERRRPPRHPRAFRAGKPARA